MLIYHLCEPFVSSAPHIKCSLVRRMPNWDHTLWVIPGCLPPSMPGSTSMIAWAKA